MSFQVRCLTVRTALGLSCRRMSARLQLSNNVWSLYEAGKKEPGLSTLMTLAGLGIDLHWLVTGEGEMLRPGSSLNSNAASTQTRGSGTRRLRSTLIRLRELVADSDMRNLSLLSRLIEILASHAEGRSLEALCLIISDHDAEVIRQNLEFLQAEGIVTLGRGLYRLLVVSITHRTTDYELQLLLAIREILEGIMPAGEADAKRAVLKVTQKEVVAGKGRNLLLEMNKTLREFDQHSEPGSALEACEMVRVMLAAAVHPRPRNQP